MAKRIDEERPQYANFVLSDKDWPPLSASASYHNVSSPVAQVHGLVSFSHPGYGYQARYSVPHPYPSPGYQEAYSVPPPYPSPGHQEAYSVPHPYHSPGHREAYSVPHPYPSPGHQEPYSVQHPYPSPGHQEPYSVQHPYPSPGHQEPYSVQHPYPSPGLYNSPLTGNPTPLPIHGYGGSFHSPAFKGPPTMHMHPHFSLGPPVSHVIKQPLHSNQPAQVQRGGHWSSHKSSPAVKHSNVSLDSKESRQFSIETLQSKSHQKYHLVSKHDLKAKANLLHADLNKDNYKEKFHHLLYWEEHEHETVLRDRCSGFYHISLPPKGIKYPKWLYEGLRRKKVHCILEICGLSEDQCDYVKQAATHAKILFNGRATAVAIILHVWFGLEGGPALLVGLEDYQPSLQGSEGRARIFATPEVEVRFQLKHSYFESLHRAIECLSPVTITKLLPAHESFVYYPEYEKKMRLKKPDMDQFSLDYEYQYDTMKYILYCSPKAPFVITGPFGTGKTRMLATTAFMILTGQGPLPKGKHPKVLLVTHHLQTADSYMDLYFGPAVQNGKMKGIEIVRLVSTLHYQYDGEYANFINTLDKAGTRLIEYQLIVSTFLTSLHLVSMLEPGFFSHILVDEAAQAREPEVVAALALADENTKIVLAGDHLQVGPQTLVLGQEAKHHGLGVSLLRRLHKLYHSPVNKGVAERYSAPMLTNYRSHPEIVRVISNLFYASALKYRSRESRLHPKSKGSSLHFVCCSMKQGDACILSNEEDLKEHCEKEAAKVVSAVEYYIRPWPEREWGNEDTDSICIIAPSRMLQRMIRKEIWERRMEETINVTVAFDIQGREYRAIFVCTSESVDREGKPANPTKSICDKFVFNTVITRAQSLVVAVGNPYRLFKIEDQCPNGRECWKEYVRHCLNWRPSTVRGEGRGSVIQLRRFLKMEVTEDNDDDDDDSEDDSILDAYFDARKGRRLSSKKRSGTAFINNRTKPSPKSSFQSYQPDIVQDALSRTGRVPVPSPGENTTVHFPGAITQRRTAVYSPGVTTQRSTAVHSPGATTQWSTAVNSPGAATQQSTAVHSAGIPTHRSTAVHTPGAATQWNTAVHSPGAATQQSTAVHSPGAATQQSTAVHSPGAATQWSTAVHSPGVTSQQSTGVQSAGIPTHQSTAVHSPGITTQQSTGVHSAGIPTHRSTAVHSSGAATQQSTAVHLPSAITQQSTAVHSPSITTQQSTAGPVSVPKNSQTRSNKPYSQRPVASTTRTNISRQDPLYPLPPRSELETDENLALLKVPLTMSTYRKKFHYLLYLEECEHEYILLNKCDGEYDVAVVDSEDDEVPIFIYNRSIKHRERDDCGCYIVINGMSAEKCEYANQAATKAIISIGDIKISNGIIVGISSKNRESVLYLWISKPPLQLKTVMHVQVKFKLKHSYFENLHKAVDRIHGTTVRKLLPECFADSSIHYRLIDDDCLIDMPLSFEIDNEYQLQTLKKLISCRSSAPFIITGPFGTGKTRVLAAAAYQFIFGAAPPMEPMECRNKPKRVLLVTHHMQTADSYLELYFGPASSHDTRIRVCRLIGSDYNFRRSKYKELHVYTSDFNHDDGYNLVVTTLLTAPALLGWGIFFSHILVDEAAQAREPEVVAALALADKYTKIVLAGDHLQVGPKTLVLGKYAQKGGLGDSLLVRLSNCYKELGITIYCSSLLNNFRSNPGILRLPSHLFYESTLQACVHLQNFSSKKNVHPNSSSPKQLKSSQVHPTTDHPLQFICTSLDQDEQCILSDENQLQQVFEKEARTLLRAVKEYVDPWPVEWGEEDLESICIIAPLRHQQNTVKFLIKKEFNKLSRVTNNVAFDIQGREYRAIFVCTSEPVDSEGKTANPTKSICDKFVFNTVITRAQSLVVAVGNPYRLFKIEDQCPNGRGCWKEYVRHCIECHTLRCTDTIAFRRELESLQSVIFEEFDRSLIMEEPAIGSEDAILDAYNRAVRYKSTGRGIISHRAKLALCTIDGDQGWCVWTGEDVTAVPEIGKNTPRGQIVQCSLQQISHRFCIAKPLDRTHKEIHILGVDNRRGAFGDSIVDVEVTADSSSKEHSFGKVVNVVEQGEDRQFICRVDPYNSIIFFPVDRKSPKIVNLPPISRGLVELESGVEPKSGKGQKIKVHEVVCFEPTSVKEGEVPRVRESIPMKIALNLLFIVWPLKWNKERRFPLGVVVGVLPRGDSMFHAERLLRVQYHVEELKAIDDKIDQNSLVAPDLFDWDGAITIDPDDARNLDDALTLKRVRVEDNGDHVFEFGVHIANVARYLTPGHPLDKLMMKRVTSVYGSYQRKNCYQPMLPHEFTSDISLNESASRYAMSVVGHAVLRHRSSSMKIVNADVEMKEGVVRSCLRLTYLDAENIMSQMDSCVSDALGERLEEYQQLCQKSMPVKEQLLHLSNIATALRMVRLGEQGEVYIPTDAETAMCPVAHGLVEEMMIWANSKVANKLIRSNVPDVVLRTQPSPNRVEKMAFLEEFSSIIHSNFQFAGLKGEAEGEHGSFLMLLDVQTRLVELLQEGKYQSAQTLLSSIYLHPQLAVVNANWSRIQNRSVYCVVDKETRRTNTTDLKHSSLNTEYTHFTSPLRRAVDVIVQRLLQQVLKSRDPTAEVQSVYDVAELKKVVQSCNIKSRNANNFENDLKMLDNALFNRNSSSCVTAYVSRVAEGKVEFCFQDIKLRHIPYREKSIKASILMSPADNKGSVSHLVNGQLETKCTWKVRITSLDGTASALRTQQYTHVTCAPKGIEPTVNKQSLIRCFVSESKTDACLEEKLAISTNPCTAAVIQPTDWNKVQEFIRLPNERNAKKVLDVLVTDDQMEDLEKGEEVPDGEDSDVSDSSSSESESSSDQESLEGEESDDSNQVLLETSHLTPSDTFDILEVENKSPFCSVEVPIKIEVFAPVKLWLMAKSTEYIMTPSIQLLDLAPHLQICIHHLMQPAACYAPKPLKQASKPRYNSIEEYAALWEAVFLAEAVCTSIRSTKASLRMIMVENVHLQWPRLDIPDNVINEPYYVPTGKLCVQLSSDFNTEKLDFFPFEVGTLVCARYCIPLGHDERKALVHFYCKKYRVKESDEKEAIAKLLGDNADGCARAIYHMVITEIEFPEAKNSPEMKFQKQHKKKQRMLLRCGKRPSGPIKVHLEMKGEENLKVSEVMKVLFDLKNRTCRMQLIPLDTPHHRVYNSLRHLTKKSPHFTKVLLGQGPPPPSNTDEKAVENFLASNKHVVQMWGAGKELNELQQKALKQAMVNRFQLIQGPPGTGKSVTGAHLAYAFALWNRQAPDKRAGSGDQDKRVTCVVYCGPSNKSVDVVLNLLEPVAKKVKILRIYGKLIEGMDYQSPLSKMIDGDQNTDHRCPEHKRHYALHHKVHRSSTNRSLIADLEEKFADLHAKNSIPSAEDRREYYNYISEAEAEVIERDKYDIVLCTCNEAFSPRFREYLRPLQVIIDEAAMAMEPECMAPIYQSQHVVLIGDHKQLQPIIDNRDAKESGLGVSLFERFAPKDDDNDDMPYRLPFTTLRVQYRMNSAVCRFPSQAFYSGKLRPNGSVGKRHLSNLNTFWPNDKWPVVFCDMQSGEEDGNTGKTKINKDSKSNTVEARKVVRIVCTLLNNFKLNADEVAVLTPYTAQKNKIKEIFDSSYVKSPVKVQTITESQGSEFGVVVLSTVRSQPVKDIANKDIVQADRQWIREKLGFVTDEHQICVGITRSKYGLVIVGNATLLSYDPTWDKLIEHYKDEKCFSSEKAFP